MADIEYGDTVAEVYPSRGAGLVSLINWLGAISSAALIVGLAWWGYQLMVRDVTGVPVVRALDGPMRVAPADPGGKNTDHQGLAVNNIAAVGEAEDPADRLVLAPKPTVLAPEDLTSGELTALEVEAEIAARLAGENSARSEGAVIETVTSDAEADEPIAQDRATLIEATLQMVQDPEEADLPLMIDPDAQAAVLQDVIPASVAGVARSLRPKARPTTILASLNLVAPQPSENVVASIDPVDIPVGTRLAQLGAFESPEIAEQEWLVLSERFDDFMGDKSRVIQEAQSGGKVFYRLRAYGFEDLSDARRFCSTLVAGKANCIPVVTR